VADTSEMAHTPPTIYDVARAAGVSIASVSRVLNGRRNPREETRERVLQAVAELGFVPDGAARALSGRLKEVVGVVIRRVRWTTTSDGGFAEEDESLQFTDVLNRGIELAAQRRGFNLLVSSVDADDHDVSRRLLALARKSDGLILHDRVLEPDQLDELARRVPIVTLANVATRTTTNVHSDNTSGMQALAVHLLADHGYRSIGYLAGRGVPQGVTAREAAFWLDTWSQLSQAVGSSQLLYHEATLLNPARTSVVLGDPAHATRVPVVVFANAPNSLREVESTTTFRTR